MLTPFLSRLVARLAQIVDWTAGWTTLPPPLGVATLLGMRNTMRRRNLYDTSSLPTTPTSEPAADPPPARYLTTRTADGSYNDLDDVAMGSAGMRFGRNVPLDRTFLDPAARILTPNPRTVSRELFTRDAFKPATTLNLLAAAWIQFQVHDWLSHGKNQKQSPWVVPLAEDDPWPQHPMRILRASPDPSRPAGYDGPPTFTNIATHWWDGSQLYGSDQATQDKVRAHEGGKLVLARDDLLPIDEKGIDVTGVTGNWWMGLALMHTLFTLEHNAICERLRSAYPTWSDDDLFDHARLVNVALMAKIHTVEWTPGILGHPTMQVAMRGEWWGVATERLYKLLGRFSSNDVISGLPGSPKDHHGVPYAMTEEFAAVYRMHPLIPDDYRFRASIDDRVLQELTFPQVVDQHAHAVLQQVGLTDALYSFGTSHPGAITLHNHPRFLQQRVEMDQTIIDVAATDVLRMRERGVPRYNEFRTLMHRPPVTSFEELTDNPVWQEELRRVYNGDIDLVDLVVGLFAEPLPPGFGFSDTALRIFLLMAPRRLQSDRFFTTDYTPTVYTQVGLDWIDANGLATVVLRHCPALAPALRNVQNPFAPWTRARPAPAYRRRGSAPDTSAAMRDGTPPVIPTVRELPLVGSLFDLRRDALAFVQRVVHECGDRGRFHLGPVEGYVVNAPAAIRGVLVDDVDAFDKGSLTLNAYRAIGQTPVLIREGEAHREERETLDPPFQPAQLARYGDVMSAYAQQAQDAWTDGATIDIQDAMLELTLRIMGKVLVDIDELRPTDPLAASLTAIADYVAHGVRTPFLLPLSVPTPGALRLRRTLAVAQRRLQVAIDVRRSGGLANKTDFLAQLLRAQDADGQGLSDAQVCDDAVEIFNAGHSNVAAALAWCVYLLATHPAEAALAQQEVDRELGGRMPTYADLDRLPYTLQVVKETLRLYPPIYILSPRRALRDVSIDNCIVRKGAMVLISPYTLHHRSDLFPDPERFHPERFAPQRAQSIPRDAWMPFNIGPHNCVGSHFALMEAHLVVATLMQRVSFTLAPEQHVVPEAGSVLRQAAGCKVIVRRRG